jgi:hypothetical protein
MELPAHGPDFAPSDFHLFGMLKGAVGGRRFRCDEDVKNSASVAMCATKDFLL